MANIRLIDLPVSLFWRFADFAIIQKEVSRYITEGNDFYTINLGGFTVTFDATKEGVKDDNETVEQMSEMSIDSAIEKAKETGVRLSDQGGCEFYSREQLQIVAWLRELKRLRGYDAAHKREIDSLRALVKEMSVALSDSLDIIGNVSEFLSLDCGTALRVETYREILAKAREVCK